MLRIVLLLVAALAATACPPPSTPVCGDGRVDPGEDAASCCLDVPCDRGSCLALADDGSPACLMPWQETCAWAAGNCLEDSPLRCAQDAAPPSYDCAGCGCGDADACVDGICYDAATRAAARDLDALPDDLDVGDYVALPLALRPLDTLPLATAAATHREEPRLDPRRNTVIVGWDARSPDVDEVVRPWLAALGAEAAPQSVTDCAPATSLWPDDTVVAVVPPDRAARVTCAWPGMFVDCVLPTNADCALGAGGSSETAIFLDLDVVLDDADAALLVRVGRAAPALRDAALVEALAAFGDAATSVGEQPGLLVAGRYAAAYPSDDAHVTWVLLRARNTTALRLGSYRVVWGDPPSQQFLVDHDIQTRDCAFAWQPFAPGELPATVTMSCANAGATLTAVIEPASFSIVDVSTSGG
ncbi:MAG: hypothetical protein HYS27_01395 [Deltaproteobacteria bacterium]|nr:hypothetical protein [Deltaproteobacteria bacterium]